MSVSSTAATSRRAYLSQSELEEIADITVTSTSEADDQINQAEELIDAYVGYQEKFVENEITGYCEGSSNSNPYTVTIDEDTYDQDYFKWCEIEIIGGTGSGQRKKITGSTKAGVLTVDSAWTTAPDTTSYFRIYQLGKFPRACDVISDTNTAGTTIYYKSIPEAVKRAVAAQLAFAVEVGTSFFTGNQSEKESESIGDYSYTNSTGSAGIARLIAPRAKSLLRGITNRTGGLV